MREHTYKKQILKTMCAACALVMFLSLSKLSKADVSSSTDIKPKKNETEKAPWTNEIELGLNTNMYKPSSTDHQSSASASFKSDYKINKIFSVGILQGAQHAFTENDGGSKRNYKYYSFDNTLLSIKESIFASNIFKISLSEGLLLPTNEEDRNEKQLIVGMSFSPSFQLLLEEWTKIHGLTLSYSPSLVKYFHRYTSDVSGKPLTSHMIRHVFQVAYEINDKWNTSYALRIEDRNSYMGNKMEPKYQNILGAAYNIDEKLSLGLELSNGADMYRPNGVDSNYAVYDSEQANISLSIGYKF